MKRKAESIVGVVTVDSEETTLRRVFRLDRAINEIGQRFNLTICKCDASGKLIGSFNATLTITAIVYQEPLRSRWARALDTIREEYGLSIEWEETEVKERLRTRKPEMAETVNEWSRRIVDSLGIGKFEGVRIVPEEPTVKWDRAAQSDIVADFDSWSDGFVSHFSKEMGIPKELLERPINPLFSKTQFVNLPRGEDIKQDADKIISTWPDWKKRYAGLADSADPEEAKNLRSKPGLVFNNDLDEVDPPKKTEEVHRGKSGDLSVLVGVEKVSVRVREGDTSQEMGERLNAAIQAHCADRGIESKYAPSVELSAKPPEPETKTYADTPTGTVEFDVDVGHLRSSRVNWRGEDTTPFKYALHLKDPTEWCYAKLQCPCCGDVIYVTGVYTVAGFYGNDRVQQRTMEDGITCSCGIKSTYDFDKEIVTMERV